MNRILLVTTLLLVSCAHTSETTPPPEDTSPVVTPSEVPWKDMTAAQKGRYMSKVVVPQMRTIFQAYDAEHFEKLNCATCHGKSAKDRDFKMPTPELPALAASPEVFMATTMKEKPEMVKFMSEKVTPLMAQLLGRKPFDHANPDPTAFSCEGCHTLKQ